MVFTVRVSREAFPDKRAAEAGTRSFKGGWEAKDMKLSIQEIVERWLEGYIILPAKMKPNERLNDANWESQKIFAIDFDNENGEKERVSDDYYVTAPEALEMARRAGLSPAFIYSSFSSAAEHVKFRMVFVLDVEVTTKQLHGEVTSKLYSIFMKGGYIVADMRCSDLSRIFYGGKELLYQNFAAVTPITHIQRLEMSNLQGISKLRSKRNDEGRRIDDYIPMSLMHSTDVRGVTTPAMTAIIHGNPIELREVLQKGTDSTMKEKRENICTVCANINPYQFMKQLPLHDILEVPFNSAIRCILHGHEDIHPSAIVKQLTDGTYAYFCHGCYGNGNGQTLVDLIIEATGCSVGATLKFVEVALGIRLETEHQALCRSRCGKILEFILSPEFRTGEWEPLFRHMKWKGILSHYQYYLEQIMLNPAIEPLIGEGIPTFYESVRQTSDRMRNPEYRYCTGIHKDSVARKRNELVYLGLIGKSTNLDHPTFAKAKEYQARVGNTHHKEFLVFPDLSEDILDFAVQQIGEAKKNGERARYRTRTALLTSRGKEVANRIFMQDAEKGIGRFHNVFITKLWMAVSRLTRKGWTTEEEVVEEIIRTTNYSGVKWKVGQYRSLITNGEIYTLERVSNDLRARLSMPDSIPLRKKIIVPVVKPVDNESSLDQNFEDVI